MIKQLNSNSRFSVLFEDLSNKNNKSNETNKKPKLDEKKENSFLREDTSSFKKNYNRDFETKAQKERREKNEKAQKERDEKKREEENKKNLAPECFPDLINKEKQCQNNTSHTMNYLKASNTIVPKIIENQNNIKPGWVEIKRDPKNIGKLIYTYGVNTNENNVSTSDSEKKSDYPVLEALVKLYNDRTKEYIDMWGYDTWEKMFRFPNYDYEYFDKLDEEYERQMEENNTDYDE